MASILSRRSLLLCTLMLFYKIFAQTVNKVTFENLEKLIDLNANITDIKHDLFLGSPYVLVSESNSLRTINLDNATVDVVSGKDNIPGYLDGSLVEAKFNNIQSITHLCTSTVLVVDTANHCVRRVDRVRNLTSTLAGQCTQPGDRDGSLQNATFTLPSDIVRLSNSDIYYVSDMRSIRQINLQTNKVITLEVTQNGPAQLAAAPAGHLYFTSNGYFNWLNTTTKSVGTVFAGRNNRTDSNKILFLSKDVAVISDSDSNELWAYSLLSASWTSICVTDRTVAEQNSTGDPGVESCGLLSPGSMLLSSDVMSLLVATSSAIWKLDISGVSTDILPMISSNPCIQATASIVPTESLTTIGPTVSNSTLPKVSVTAQPDSVAKSATNPLSTPSRTTASLPTQSSTSSLTQQSHPPITSTTSQPQTSAVQGTTIIPNPTITTQGTAMKPNPTSTYKYGTTEVAPYVTSTAVTTILGLQIEHWMIIGVGGIVAIIVLVFLIVFRKRIAECCCKRRNKANIKMAAKDNLYITGTIDSQLPEQYVHMLGNNNEDLEGASDEESHPIPLIESTSSFRPYSDYYTKPISSFQVPAQPANGIDYIRVKNGGPKLITESSQVDSEQ